MYDFTPGQIAGICCGIIFILILIGTIIFSCYASRKARVEDSEVNRAAVGKWKEAGEVVVRGVPPPVARVGNPFGETRGLSARGERNESLPESRRGAAESRQKEGVGARERVDDATRRSRSEERGRHGRTDGQKGRVKGRR